MGYDTLKLRLQSGGSLRKSMIDDARFMFDCEFENDVSAENDFCLCEGVTPKKPLSIRLFKDRVTSSGGYTKNFAVRLCDSLYIGDLLYDCDENAFWLCKSAVKKGSIYCTGTLQRCVEMPLKWQDDEGNVFEYPVFDYSQFNSDETDYNVVNVGEGRRKLTTIADDNTVRLRHDKRFFWDRNTENPTVMKVTQNNSTSMFYDKGLVIITVIEDQYNPEKDNLAEWICDYKTPKAAAPSLQWNGDNRIRIGRSRRIWVDTESVVEWSIDSDSAARGISAEKSGSSVKISVPLDEKLIGEVVCVTAVINSKENRCEFEIIGGV